MKAPNRDLLRITLGRGWIGGGCLRARRAEAVKKNTEGELAGRGGVGGWGRGRRGEKEEDDADVCFL